MARPNYSQVAFTYDGAAGVPSLVSSDFSSDAPPPRSAAASSRIATLDGDSSDDCPIAELLQQRGDDRAPLLPIRFHKASVSPPAPAACSTVIPESDRDDAPLAALATATLPLSASPGVSAEFFFLDEDEAPLATLGNLDAP